MNKLVVGVLAAAIVFLALPVKGETPEEKAAVAAANHWLGLIDKGEYAKSWDEAAGYFKDRVQSGAWTEQLKGVRDPLGKMTGRKVKTAKYTTSVPGAPDGEYVIIQFDTSFEHKKNAVETVTPMKEKDGSWHVSGYLIR